MTSLLTLPFICRINEGTMFDASPPLTDTDLTRMVAKEIPQQFLTFKYQLRLTAKQHDELAAICEGQRVLFNAALQERIECYRKTGKSRSYMSQCKALTELRELPEFFNIPVNLQRWTLKRIDDAFAGFFSRIKKGNKAGFPRFRGKHYWKAFGFAEFSGITFDGKAIRFKGLSTPLRVHLSRPLQGEIKSCVFRRDLKGWNICFQCATPITAGDNPESVGIDVGLLHLATLSTGEHIPNPHIAKQHQSELRRRQRALARCKKGSERRRKVREKLAAAHSKIRNIRQNHSHQVSSRLAREYGTIAVEDLKIRNMVKNHCLAGAISDAAWGAFINNLSYKVAKTGGRLIKVEPRNTSQACSGCGQIVPKELNERIHACDCGTVLDRDVNAARVILSRGGMAPWLGNVGELTPSVQPERRAG